MSFYRRDPDDRRTSTPDTEFARACAKRIHAALYRWELEGEVWPTKQSELRRIHNADEFYDAVSPIYQSDHDKLVAEVSNDLLTGLTDLARAYGVRFISLGERDLICFENYRSEGTFGRPAAWQMCDLIDHLGLDDVPTEGRTHVKFGGGAGNGPQHQVSFVRCMLPRGSWGKPALAENFWGIYDLRDGGLIRRCDALTLNSMRRDFITRKYPEDVDLNVYLALCGAKIDGYEVERWGGAYKCKGYDIEGKPETPIKFVAERLSG